MSNEIPENEDRSTEELQAAAPITPVGMLLQQGRLKKDWTEVDVANRLRLSRNVVLALENDEYDKLPGLTFVRGYLRSYARLVDLSADEIINQFKTLGLVEPDKLLPATISLMKKEASISDRAIRGITYIIVLGLAGLMFLWWYSQSMSTAPQPSDLMAATADSAALTEPMLDTSSNLSVAQPHNINAPANPQMPMAALPAGAAGAVPAPQQSVGAPVNDAQVGVVNAAPTTDAQPATQQTATTPTEPTQTAPAVAATPNRTKNVSSVSPKQKTTNRVAPTTSANANLPAAPMAAAPAQPSVNNAPVSSTNTQGAYNTPAVQHLAPVAAPMGTEVAVNQGQAEAPVAKKQKKARLFKWRKKQEPVPAYPQDDPSLEPAFHR